ncbi:uncharacterized protein LOC121406321 [Lytechinus variegatus]|uniref:uncharacterized protein LOC121406321 n=1 Tax=Lytechinus variegatus TaxID=7654 RepID=UPI001BB2342F|nr:uncharacterized protein LOC121406321 [Lytechinus variegatus]
MDDDEEDDCIHLEKHGITVRISKYEIYDANDINVEVIEDVPPELELKEKEAIISVGLKMTPSEAIFDSPVKVTMPHCGIFTQPEAAEICTYYRKSASSSFCAIPSTSTSTPWCVVRDRDLDIYLNHFSEYWIVAAIKWAFLGKRVICTPNIPVSPKKDDVHVVFVQVRDENVKGETLYGYEAPMLGEQFLLRWYSSALNITCPESTKKNIPKTLEESELCYLSNQRVMFKVDTRDIQGNKVILQFILKQHTEKEIFVPMNLIAPLTNQHKHDPHASIAAEDDVPSTARKVTDKTLIELAEHIPPSHYYNLSINLGIEYNIARNILSRHRDDNVEAMRECFSMWKNKLAPSVDDLNKLLTDVELGMLFVR